MSLESHLLLVRGYHYRGVADPLRGRRRNPPRYSQHSIRLGGNYHPRFAPTEWGDPVFAEIDHDRFDALKLAKGHRVYARPKEKPRVFVYQI
jgi:hypothetical protein